MMPPRRLLLFAIASGLLGSACSRDSMPTRPGPTPAFDSGSIPRGGAFQHAFPDTGTFGYHCGLHTSEMSGSVTVAIGGAESALVIIQRPPAWTGPSYAPNSVTIKPTGIVRWMNADTTHTVTSDS